MKLPSTIPSVLGPVEVIVSPDADKHLDKRGWIGCWSGQERTILIHRDQCDASKLVTLGHEMFHMVVADSGHGQMLNKKLEESLCDAFGTWFANAVSSGKLVLK